LIFILHKFFLPSLFNLKMFCSISNLHFSFFYLKKEHMELLRNTPVQEDYSGILMEVADSLDNYSSQYLKENIKKNVSN
jgi:hypothetical protein